MAGNIASGGSPTDWGSILARLGIGTGVAGAAGLGSALAGGQSMGEFFGGKPAGQEIFQRYTPGQQMGQNQMLQQALGGLTSNQFDFAPIAQRAQNRFSQQTVPGLAERFTSMGSGSALSSPSFISQLGQAGAGLQEGLAAQEAGYGLDQQKLNMMLAQLGLQPQFESAYRPRQQGFLESGAQGIMSFLPLLGLL